MNQKTFLIVEDDAGNIVMLEGLLQSVDPDAKTIIASTLEEAEHQVSALQSVDVIIWDGLLPGGITTDGLMQAARQKFPSSLMIATSGTPNVFAEQMKICDAGVAKGSSGFVGTIVGHIMERLALAA
jgi:response regulator of citrate/malate metabolism